MRESIRLGHVAGIPVGVHWSLLLVAALLTWSLASWQLPEAAPGLTDAAYLLGGLSAAGLFFGSVLAHEIAHALTARRHGVGTDGITLWLFGGVARLDREAPNAGAEFQIAAAGPATSMALGAGFLGLAIGASALGVGDLLVTVGAWLGIINLVLALFNLLPGAPLDGGRILAAALWRWHGDRTRAAVSASRAGQVLGLGLAALPVLGLATGFAVGSLWTTVMGLFLWQTARAEGEGARIRGALRDRLVRDVMVPVDAAANDWWTVDDLMNDLGPRPAWAPPPRVVLLADWNGRPSGLLLTSSLHKVPVELRRTVRLRDVGIPPSAVRTARPDDRVLDVLQRPGPSSMFVAVIDADRVVGVVTPDVLRWWSGPARPAQPPVPADGSASGG